MKQTIRWIVAILLYYSGIVALYERAGSKGVLILCYHRIGGEGRDPFEMSMPRSFFARQISLLAARRPVIPLSEALGRLEGGGHIGEPATVITFDDGYADNLTAALPVLVEQGTPATFFLTASLVGSTEHLWYDRIKGIILAAKDRLPGTIRFAAGSTILSVDPAAGTLALIGTLVESCKPLDRPSRESAIARLAEELGVEETFREEDRLLTWEEAKSLARGGGEVGSHGCSHTILSASEDEEREVADSKRILEERLGVPVGSFAYPNGKAGDFGPASPGFLRKAGYRCALTTIEGENLPGCDPFVLRRKCLDYDDCAAPFGGFSRALFLCETGGIFRRLSWWKRENHRDPTGSPSGGGS